MTTDELERRLARRTAHDSPFDAAALAAALERRAAADGLLDVAFGSVESPLGPLTVFVTPRGLVRLDYPGDLDASVAEVAASVSPRVLAAPRRTDPVRRQLEDYFEGRRRAFEVPIDWRLVRGFAAKVLRATARVPFGSVTTYRDVAAAVGSPLAYRAAGNALGSNPLPIVVPCHRVLHTGGGLGGYTGGLSRKEFLLTLEGTLPSRRGTRA